MIDKTGRIFYNKGKKRQGVIIMAKTTANISIDAETKRQAQELFAEFGMDLSTAVTIFFRQAIWEHAMPFDISRHVPNADTIAAMKEAEDFKEHPEKFKRYSSFADVLKEVEEDA